jgi:hypothetical protein
MNVQDFDRMMNPLDVQEGLDELPGFVPDEAYISLRDECAKAYVSMQLQRTHRFSMADLKAVIDRFEGLARRADQVMRYYGANDGFICRYMEICERYAALEGYMQISDRLTYTLFESGEIRTIKQVVELRDSHSAMYDQTYFVKEFSDFRFHFEICREAALFLTLDTKNAQTALRDVNVLSEIGWINYYQALFERINEMLGLLYFPFNTDYRDYFHVQCFKIDKMELLDMIHFMVKMGELRHLHWKRQLTVK